MPTRDRTEEFRRGSLEPTMGSNFLAPPGRSLRPSISVQSTDVLLSEVDRVLMAMDQLSEQVKKLKVKQEHILEAVLVIPRDKLEMENLISDIKRQTQELRPHIIKLKAEISRDKAEEGYRRSKDIRRKQYDYIKTKFGALIEELRNAEVHHKEKVMERARRQLEVAGNHLSPSEISRILDFQGSDLFYRKTSLLSVASKIALEDASDRCNEILHLEKYIAELNELFIDIQGMVSNQGDLVDAVQINVENAQENVNDGNRQVDEARKYKWSALKKKYCCYAMIGAVILAVIIVVVVFVVLKKI
ncbi:hypothetical protein L596_016874 [Steinernema carpocapsae]|uniref:t-SNARE coiled-coil homology domain-containing protein n=1 Tax=Steinernema carpocapsae TaxID=34508 RepID=A0A4U5NKH6_STECR|nr:hypothetical protein L596_016874 [Steinernema carpocapsae]